MASFSQDTEQSVEGVVRTDAAARYSRVAMVLHWTIALLIIFNFAFGYFMSDLPEPWRGVIVSGHFSAGITVLLLTAVRIVWRALHAPPPYPEWMKSWERKLAHLVHVGLYGAMILVPLTGWILISATPPTGSAGRAYAMQLAEAQAAPASAAPGKQGAKSQQPKGGRSRFWWVAPMPRIELVHQIGETPGGVAPQKVIQKKFMAYHETAGLLMLGLLFLHIAGALKHQWIDRHPELARMGIGGWKKR